MTSKNQLKRIKREKKEYVSPKTELEVIAYENYQCDQLNFDSPEVIQYYKKWKYPSYLSTRYWGEVKRVVHSKLKTCEICNQDKNLQVHHTTYSIKGKELLGDNLQKLMLVCRSCHLLIHGGLTETRRLRRLRRAKKVRKITSSQILKRKANKEKYLKLQQRRELKAKRKEEIKRNTELKAKQRLEKKAKSTF